MLGYSIGSTQDRDDLYAELTINNIQWGEIRIIDGNAEIILYHITDEDLIFPYEEFINIVMKAKKRLFEIECLPE